MPTLMTSYGTKAIEALKNIGEKMKIIEFANSAYLHSYV